MLNGSPGNIMKRFLSNQIALFPLGMENMNILVIVVIIIALLIYTFIGFMYWSISMTFITTIFSNNIERIKTFKPQLYKSRRLLFLARVKEDSVDISMSPLWIVVYPLFYYFFGWNVLMYSYVFAEEEMSNHLKDAGVDMNMNDLYGQNAATLQDLARKRKFENCKYPESLQRYYRGEKATRAGGKSRSR